MSGSEKIEMSFHSGTDEMQYNLIKFNSKEDADLVYEILKSVKNKRFPGVIRGSVDDTHCLRVAKNGSCLKVLLEGEIEKNKKKEKTKFFKYYGEHSIHISKIYAKIIRDVFTTIRLLEKEEIHPVLSKDKIFVQEKHFEATIVEFEKRGDQGDQVDRSYVGDCNKLKEILEEINKDCGMSGDCLNEEFRDFFQFLTNQELRDSVLNRPLFWDEEMRIWFVQTLDDFLKADFTDNAFRTSISLTEGKVGDLLQEYGNYLSKRKIKNSLSCRLLADLTGPKLTSDEEIRAYIEMLKNIYEHLLDIKTSQKHVTKEEYEEMIEECEHTLQFAFPKHVVILFRKFSGFSEFEFKEKDQLDSLYNGTSILFSENLPSASDI